MKNLYLTLCLHVLFALGAKGSHDFSGFPFITNYTTADYGAGIQNWGITQDRNGILYIANNYGLLEFDGTRWKVYGVSNGTKVRSVAIGTQGHIYVGAQNEFGFFYPNAVGTLVYHSLVTLLPPTERNFDEIWRTFIINNEVYFCSFRNIYRYDGEQVQIVSPSVPLEFTFLCNGTLYSQFAGKGLATLQNGRFDIINGSEFLADHRIADLIPFNRTTLLVATVNHGLYLYDGSSFKPWSLSISDILKNASISSLYRLADGTLLIGTANDGLYITQMDGSSLQHFSKGKGINNRTVLSIFQDRERNIWLGLNNGLAKIELSSPFTLINERLGVQGTGYASYIKDNTLYLGTNNGLFACPGVEGTGYVARKFELVPNTAGQVYSITEFYDRLHIGHHEGAYVLDNGSAKKLEQLHSGVWQFKQVPNHPGKLLTGTYSGFSLVQHNKAQVLFQYDLDGFSESSRVFEEGTDGSIWMSHGYKGVFRLQLSQELDRFETIDFFNKDNGFPSNILINVFRANNQLVFASERGVYRFKQGDRQFVLDPVFSKVLGEDVHVREMEEDAFGNVYLSTNRYTGILKKGTFNEYKLENRHFNKIHSLLNDDLENISALDHENVLFGAKEGFIHYNPQKARQYDQGFNVVLRKVMLTANGDSVIFGGSFTNNESVIDYQDTNQDVTLPYQANSLSFQYAALFFDSPSKIQYRIKLEPFETQWSGWNAKAEKEYTNLREGDYTFQVMSRNIYGTESPVAAYHFTILPPWYRSNWAYLLYLAVSLLAIGLIIQVQRVLYQKEKRIMTISQNRQLIQKDNELEQVSKKSQQEIVKLQTEKMASEINHKNKELATTTMNLINKNKLLTDIKDSLLSFTKENNRGKTSNELNRIIKKIDFNMGRDDEWEHFMQYFDEVHGDFSRRLRHEFPQLSPQDLKLCAYLRMNLSTKEIAQLLNITIRGVEIARYRLRKKLGLDRSVNLAEYILNF